MSIKLILNYFNAWLCVLFVVFLASKYFIRKMAKNSNDANKTQIRKLNRTLKIPHIVIGFLLIIIGLLHGIFSSQSVFSLNTGTLCFVLCILLALSWLIKNLINKNVSWRKLHVVLAILLALAMIWHVVDHGGVRVFKAIKAEQTLSEMQVEKNETYGDSDDNDADVDVNQDNIDASVVTTVDPFEKYFFSFEGLELNDGVYQVVSEGYSEGMVLEVIIENNIVTSIEIISHNEMDVTYYQPAIDEIPDSIIAAQSLEIDVVSGSTMTTLGIINGVRDSILEAAGRSDLISE